MRRPLSFVFIILFILFSYFLNKSSVIAQSVKGSRDYAPSDTVFNEISLNDEGVEAVDTAGYDWYYDFEKDVFIAGDPLDDIKSNKLEFLEELSSDNFSIEQRCTEKKKVSSFIRSVLVRYDEYVDGNIIAYGRVTIKGWVKGDVKSIDKRVLVTSTGRVDGDIEAPEIIVKKGGIVLGRQIETDIPLELKDITTSFSIDGVIVVLSFTVFFLFFGFLIVSLMPQKLDNFNYCFNQYKLKTSLLGFLFLLLVPVIILLVTITIVGSVLIPLIPLIYLFAIIMGFISFGNMIGHTVSMRFIGKEKSMMFQSLTGILILMTLWLVVAVLLGSDDTTSEGFGIFFLVMAILISSYPVCSGVGTAVLTFFGFKPYTSWKDLRQYKDDYSALAPAPPPIPDSPSMPPSTDTSDNNDETS